MRKGSARKAAEEDIEAVLSRFQAWSGSAGSTASAASAGAKDAARQTPPPTEGVREISYDEALESSRSRWKRPTATPLAAPETGSTPLRKDSAKSTAPPAMDVASGNPKAETTSAATGPAAMAVPAPTAVAVNPPSSRSARRTPGGASSAPRGVVERTSLRQEFQSVLAQSIEGPSNPKPRRDPERQVSMSLRVAASEQALIRRRAADAGVSASAYLRQCALDVETLRAQVQQLMAAAARSRLAEYSEPVLTPLPVEHEGWLTRWQRRIWGTPARQLSLKA